MWVVCGILIGRDMLGFRISVCSELQYVVCVSDAETFFSSGRDYGMQRWVSLDSCRFYSVCIR